MIFKIEKFLNKIIEGDCLEILKKLPEKIINTCVTSPPYWGLRDYGAAGQMGLEETPEKYVENMVKVFQEVRRVLKDDGTLWLNLGDSYIGNATGSQGNGGKLGGGRKTQIEAGKRPDKKAEGLKPKNLCGIPWRVAFALQSDGWYLRQDIIWHKPNPMPESVTDRCTKAHEYIFLLSKSQRYYYNADAIKDPIKDSTREDRRLNNPEYQTARPNRGYPGQASNGGGLLKPSLNGANKRSVWTVTTKPYSEAHFATFPEDLIDPCVKAGCPKGGVVLDPFMGSGTTAKVAIKNGCKYLGMELNPKYIKLADRRNSQIDIMEII